MNCLYRTKKNQIIFEILLLKKDSDTIICEQKLSSLSLSEI